MIHRLITSRMLAIGLVILAPNTTTSISAQELPDRPNEEGRDREIEREEESDEGREPEGGWKSQIQREFGDRIRELIQDREEGMDIERIRELIEAQLQRDRSRTRPPAVGRDDQRTMHFQQAIEHLQSIGWHDEAERLKQRWSRTEQRRQSPPRGPDARRWGDVAEERMQNVHEMLGQLRQAIEDLERRTANSEQVVRAADEAQRRAEELRTEVELRTRELERQLSQRFNELEREVAKRLEELERNVRDRTPLPPQEESPRRAR
jgi:hypothetical protein